MFASSIRPLWNRRHRGVFMLVIIVCLLVTTTGKIAIFITVNYNAFVRYRENPGVDTYFQTLGTLILPLESGVLPSSFMAGAVFTCDILILWRLYHVCSRNWWIVVVPAAFLFIESVLYVVIVAKEALHIDATATTIACGVTTDLVNFICTPLIVGRLWWVGRRGQLRETRSLYNTIVVRFIESGSLYTITQIVYMGVTFTPGYPGVSAFWNYVFTMAIAIAPMLVVLHLNKTIMPEMHLVGFDVTPRQGGGEGVVPRRNMGLVSTTIAFNPLTLASDQPHTPSHDATEPNGREGGTA
ncbi:hypothetical protein FRB98_001484 [Tulasnella sp. 332]|nr:hypothetical protein FRB98_001484 [Tulasnella sp. 332]